MYKIVIEDHVHVENGVTDLILFISQMEIPLEACNASISCILTLVLYLVVIKCYSPILVRS